MSSSVNVLDDAAFERVRYYARQLLTAEDMRAEQNYVLDRARRHNSFLHGWGVVSGCDVQSLGGTPWRVSVSPGYVVTPQGDELWISAPTLCDVSENNEPGQTVYLAVRYAEFDSRPAPTASGGGACVNGDCEYTRIHDGFELTTLSALPDSHAQAASADQQWCNALQAWANDRSNPMPVPPFIAAGSGDVWVVLATVQLPALAGTSLDGDAISYQGRRALYSASALRQLATCLEVTPPPTTAPPTTPPPTTAPPTTAPPTTAPPSTPPPTTAPPTTPPPTTAPPTTPPPTTQPPVPLTNFTIHSLWQNSLHHYFGTVTLAGGAPSGGIAVAIECDEPDIVTGPTSVLVAEGHLTEEFEFEISDILDDGQADVTITATLGQISIHKTVTIRLVPAGDDK